MSEQSEVHPDRMHSGSTAAAAAKTGRLPEVPETLLKRRKLRAERKAKRARLAVQKKQVAIHFISSSSFAHRERI